VPQPPPPPHIFLHHLGCVTQAFFRSGLAVMLSSAVYTLTRLCVRRVLLLARIPLGLCLRSTGFRVCRDPLFVVFHYYGRSDFRLPYISVYRLLLACTRRPAAIAERSSREISPGPLGASLHCQVSSHHAVHIRTLRCAFRERVAFRPLKRASAPGDGWRAQWLPPPLPTLRRVLATANARLASTWIDTPVSCSGLAPLLRAVSRRTSSPYYMPATQVVPSRSAPPGNTSCHKWRYTSVDSLVALA